MQIVARAENLTNMEDAILLLTDNQGPRYEQMVRQVMQCTRSR